MPSPRTIRSSLLLNVLSLLLAAGIAIGGSMVVGTRMIVRRLSGEVIAQAQAHTLTRLQAFFEPVTERLGELRRWSARGLIDMEDPVGMTRLIAPMLAEMDQVSSLMVADTDGNEIMVLEMEAGWRTRHTRHTPEGASWTEYDWQDDPGEAVPRDIPNRNYDPRERPWFLGATAPEGTDPVTGAPRDTLASLLVWWTPPYTFFTTGDPGMTASLSFDSADGRRLVVGFDVLLTDISSFTTELTVGSTGMVVVMDDQGRVVGLPRVAQYQSADARREALLRSPRDLGIHMVADAARVFSPGPVSTPDAPRVPTVVDEPVRFSSGGDAWWGELRSFRMSRDQQLWVAVLMPERDLLGRFAALRFAVIGVVLASLLIAIRQGFVLARRFSAPIESLVRESDRIGSGNLEAGERIESRVQEVQQLAEAQDRMRDSLRTLVKVERDLRIARDIQQGTFPKTLPKLAGFELFGLTHPADETGGDTYDIFGFSGPVGQRRMISDGEAEGAMLMLADATGHGVGPAIAATQLRAMIRIVGALGGMTDMASLMGQINDRLCDDLPENRFITAWVAVLDAATGLVRSVSAGQAPLLHLAEGGTVARWLDADAPPFGIVPGLPFDAPREIMLEPGDVFAVLSDGFYEEPSPSGEQFGRERVLEIIRACHDESGQATVAALCAAVDAHTGQRPPLDDRTAVIVRREH